MVDVLLFVQTASCAARTSNHPIYLSGLGTGGSVATAAGFDAAVDWHRLISATYLRYSAAIQPAITVFGKPN